jgi:hypothetical protein
MKQRKGYKMSHVDDGELTAYADGAYPVNDPEALRISAHLSTCGNCRTRLEQSQELRTRAAEILSFATPATLSAPSFESLQSQVTTSSRTRPAIPLAWAATIVLSLGIGWFGRAAWQTGELGPRSVAVQDAVTSAPVATQEEQQSIAPPAVVPPTEKPAVLGDNARGSKERTRQLAESDLAQPKPTANAAADVAVGSVAGAGRAAAAEAPSAPPSPTTAAAPELMAERRAVVVGTMQYMSAADAERLGLKIPRIPQLPIARVGVSAAATTVEQTLPDGKLVTLVVTSEAREETLQRNSAKVAAPTAAQGQREVRDQDASLLKDGRRITVRADVSADSLQVLLSKVR